VALTSQRIKHAEAQSVPVKLDAVRLIGMFGRSVDVDAQLLCRRSTEGRKIHRDDRLRLGRESVPKEQILPGVGAARRAREDVLLEMHSV
jgi:hypothetical protein